LTKALKILDNINLKICYISMGAAFFLMCMTTVHALLRKFTTLGGITDSLDLTTLSMTLIVFCAFAFMESQRGHVRVDVLVNLLPKKADTALQGVMLIISGIFLFILFYAVTSNITTIYARGAATMVLKIPHWPFYIVMAVGLCAYAITVFLHGIEKFRPVKEEKVAEIEVENENGVEDHDFSI